MESKEPKENIEGICKHDSDERHKNWQLKNPKTLISSKDHVKCCFYDEEATEYMWVKVERSERKASGQILIHGRLDNAPVLVTNVKYMDKVTLSYSDISDHIKYK